MRFTDASLRIGTENVRLIYVDASLSDDTMIVFKIRADNPLTHRFHGLIPQGFKNEQSDGLLTTSALYTRCCDVSCGSSLGTFFNAVSTTSTPDVFMCCRSLIYRRHCLAPG